MGGDIDKEFTKEELAILGEVDESEEALGDEQQGDDTEQEAGMEETEPSDDGQGEEEAAGTGDQEPADEQGAETGKQEETEEKTSVQKRIDTLTARNKQFERDLDSYRVKAGELSRDEFFEKHKAYPAGEAEKEEKPKAAQVITSDIWDLVVEGGEHNGKRLGDVYDEGGAASRVALDLYNQEVDRRRENVAKEKARADQVQRESEAEIDALATEISQELFEKPLDGLGTDEVGKVNTAIQETLDWMKETGRGFANIKDAYVLKNLDKMIARAEERGAKGLIKATDESKTTPNVGGKRAAEPSGFGRFEAMTESQLIDAINDMTDVQYLAFISKAPKSLRSKFPGVEWAHGG